MIPLPFSLKTVIIGVAILASFVVGWTTNGWRHDAKLKKSLQEKIELQKVYDDYAREVASKFQQQQAEQVIVYRELKRKVNNVTDNRVCFADSNALSLWNSSLTGLPQTSTGTTKTTTSTNTATDTSILINAIENFEQSKQIRDQLNALIDWHEKNK